MTRTIEFTNDVSQVTRLAEWIELLAEDWQLPASCTFQLNLALEEALVNVIDYAYPSQTDMPIRLKAEKLTDENSVRFVLEDDGIPFDPTKAEAPDITLSAEERQIGGLGIFIVNEMMAEVEYQRLDDKNILTMVYAIQS